MFFFFFNQYTVAIAKSISDNDLQQAVPIVLWAGGTNCSRGSQNRESTTTPFVVLSNTKEASLPKGTQQRCMSYLFYLSS